MARRRHVVGIYCFKFAMDSFSFGFTSIIYKKGNRMKVLSFGIFCDMGVPFDCQAFRGLMSLEVGE